ncbi:hypothetical protein PFISCL1PPCAC_21854, partial [Pristionchus fissidentatus]
NEEPPVKIRRSTRIAVKKKNNSFPILELPAELSFKILSYMGRKELGVCLQSLPLDKVHAEWSKDNRIESMTIKKYSKMDMAELKCDRYYSSKIIKSSLSHIYDRFNEVYEKCEIGTLTVAVSPNVGNSLYRELIESCKRIKSVDDLMISFPILDLSGELSSKILSYLGSKELSVCMHSLALDKVHAEWNKDEKLKKLEIQVQIDHNVHKSVFQELIDSLIGIRCSAASINGKFDLISNENLRELISNKNMLEIRGLGDLITAAGILTVWQDLLDGKFEGLKMYVNKSLSDELFHLLDCKLNNSQFEEEQVESAGREPPKRYEIWSDKFHENSVTMSIIYKNRPWMSAKYKHQEFCEKYARHPYKNC